MTFRHPFDERDEPLPPMVAVPSVLDAVACPDEVAAWALEHGPSDAATAPLLAAARTGRLSLVGRANALSAIERTRAMLDAVQMQLMAEMGQRDPDGKDWVREDIACALRVSPMTAANRLELARSLTRFPTTMKLLESGSITLQHVRRLDEATVNLDDESASIVESLVVEQAVTQTVSEFGKAVQRAALTVDAATAEERHEMARKDRRVAVRAVADGMGEMFWYAPLDELAEAKNRIDAQAMADSRPGEVRTSDQRRSDAVHTIFRASDAAPTESAPSASPRVHGMRPAVVMTASLPTLMGAAEAPGELKGFGAIPAFLARRIAADPTASWRLALTDQGGRLLDYGRTTYRPPADLARHVIARDRTCCFPGCPRSAERCEQDHRIAWPDGGTTSSDNMFALCPRHHHLKHEGGWRYEPLPDGDLLWTSPSGRRYKREAKVYPDDRYMYDPPRRNSVRTPLAPAPIPDDPPF